MKKITILSLSALISIGCANQQTQTVQQTQTNANKTVAAAPQQKDATVSSHSFNTSETRTGKSAPKSAGDSSSVESSPMARAIDVSEMTAAIEKNEAAFKKNPSDEKAKQDLAKSYFVRAMALTEAAQYRAALGDFRKGLKLDPNNQEAKNMHDEIIRIFATVNREPPKEGEEPKPMPFDKPKT